jgi:phosphoribosylformylglycinamidine cyclo-ligase
MQNKDTRYERRGVSPDKGEVHAAIKKLDKGLYPKAFCKILPDFTSGDSDSCNIMHADTAGTKTSLAYIYWKETGDKSVWRGIAQDALVMNLDDMGCVGCLDNIILSSTIGRNKNIIPGEIIAEIIDGTVEFLDTMSDYGIHIHHAGGETADVGDIVRTADVGFTTFAKMKKSDLIINNISENLDIISVASFGLAPWEKEYNSGIGSNGLTSGRHDVLHSKYRKYTESYSSETPIDLIYSGKFDLNDLIKIDSFGAIPIGKLLLSPTRTYLPLLKKVVPEFKSDIKGLIHCSGGGQTKVNHFIDNVHVIKNNLPTPPPLFTLIQETSGTEWHEMYKVFNMGYRLEFYVNPSITENLLKAIKEIGLEAIISGRTEIGNSKKISIINPLGIFEYNA